MTDRKRITSQAISAIFKTERISRSTWTASGRVKGWGHHSPGIFAEQRERFDPNAGGGIRTAKGWKRDYQGNMMKRGAWKKDTGIFDVGYRDHEWAKQHDEKLDEYLARFLDACRAKGWTVEKNEDRWIVHNNEEEERHV